VVQHRLTEVRGGDQFNLPVRIRQPLALPFVSSEAKDLVYPVYYPNKTHLVPQSAIFYASRLYCLRKLVRNLEVIESGLANCRPGHREHGELMKRKQEVFKQIYSVLLAASLYTSAMLRRNSEESNGVGIDKLGFYAETWLRTYENGTAKGSEIFGMKDGFGLNGEFLLKYRKELSSWSEEAAQWWCPDASHVDHIGRLVLGDALKEMKKELFEMYAAMVSPVPCSRKEVLLTIQRYSST